MFLVNPPVKKIDLHFPLGLEVSARNNKGVTIKDALDAIHKQFKKKVFFISFFCPLEPHIARLTHCQASDEIDKPYLAGFEWNKNDCWTRLVVHQSPVGTSQQPSKKTKKREQA